ncbi:MAG: hypothetical protein ACLVH9_08390 [Fusobacterium sp.]|uniref:hypothetical protein n=1 Tax=Fusobacterium sp. TaxID=68766 RepID=UPI00399C31CB
MKNLKNLFLCVILIFMSSLTFSSNENSKIYLNERRREPAKMTIGVTKLKTKELPMNFDVKNKIIYTELPQELNENDLIYVSETLDEIPSTSTTNGRKSINNIKKYLTKEVKSSSNFNYQIIKGNKENGIEEGKSYLAIKCKRPLKSVYIYVVENGSYKVKNIYRGTFKNKISTFAIEAGNGNIVFDTSKILYTKEILGTYNVTETGVVFTRAFDGKKIENPNFVNITTPNKYIDETGEANRVRIKFENDDTGKEKYQDKTRGLFDLSFNIANGHMRIYTVENSSKVQFDFDLTNWNGSAINKTITIEHMDEGILGPVGDKIIATQTINLSIPAFIVETNNTTIDISNPIVEYEKDDTYLGVVKVGIDGTKTLSSSGSDYFINNPWIKADNPAVYDGNILGKHRVLITSGANRYEGNTGSNGSSLTAILGAGEKNKLMWKYFGGTDKTTAFGVDEYDFIGGSYNVKIQHFNKDTNEIFKIYNYTVKLPAFDGTVYLDKTLEIGKTEKFEKEYEIFSAPNGKILLGSTGLKSLDRRITYTQNGGDGVSVRLLTQNVILKKEGTEYTLRGTLTIEDNGSINNQIRGANREDTSARSGNVYLTLTPSEEEKLVSGGKYHILTADNKEPLQIGVKADTGEFLKTVSELWLVTTEKYNKININFKNDGMPLINDKGWIDYIDGTISGYTGNWGEITGAIREIPLDTTEIYLLDGMGRKIISGNSWTGEVPIGKSTVTVNFDGTNLKFGVKEGHYFVGEKGKFFLRYVDTKNNKYLKIEEVDVEFILNKLTSNATIRFLNPMMAEHKPLGTGTWPSGTVTFGAIKNGEVITTGNHSYTHSDAKQWWEVKNAYPYRTGEIDYEVYNKDGVSFGKINTKNLFIIITPKQKISYYIAYSVPENIELGIHSGYDGNRVNDVIYLVGKDVNGTVVRYEKINIEIDEFEPNAYGFLAPVENGITVENKKRQVGTGVEYLKDNVAKNVLIDLGTNFRFYSRFKGIIECMQSQDLDLQTAVDVIAKPVGDGTTIINGKLKLVKGTENVTNITMPETKDLGEKARPEHYSLKFEVSPEEYKKLTIGTEYQIFKTDNNDRHTLTIGLKNTSVSPLRKNLKMDKALNFRTTGSSIEIKVQNDILDFGKININEKTNGTNIIREGYTYVTVVGNGINDFSVTPNNNQMGETEIYLINADGSQDITKKLQVSRLKAEKVSERQTVDKLIRIYNLNGIVTVPKDSIVGEYTGQTVVNVTIIN